VPVPPVVPKLILPHEIGEYDLTSLDVGSVHHFYGMVVVVVEVVVVMKIDV